jgi:hypothetical protein
MYNAQLRLWHLLQLDGLSTQNGGHCQASVITLLLVVNLCIIIVSWDLNSRTQELYERLRMSTHTHILALSSAVLNKAVPDSRS